MLLFHLIASGLFVLCAALSLLFRNWRYAAHAATLSNITAGGTIASGLWLLLSSEGALSTICIRASTLVVVLALAAVIRRDYIRA
jgi:hypothetical protein